MKRHSRRQIMIDQSVQGALTARVAVYWALSMCFTLLFASSWAVWQPAAAHTTILGMPVSTLVGIGGSLIVLPIAIVDMIRISNRFVGPVHSLRNQMKRLLLGDRVERLQLREKDFWHDLIRQFNRLQPTIQSSVEGQMKSEKAVVNDRSGYPIVVLGSGDADSFVDLPYSSR
ncbi:MAG: hypothetical protein P8N76_18220 [Pirellulaceae bacterium]|nr:hypothetical protein [Pirellulaceae bacterium]